MSYVVVVRMRVKDGEEQRALELLRELAAETRREAGCEAYVPCVDPEDARSLVLYEQYADRAAFEAHGASDHFQRLAAGQLWGLLDGPRERSFFETVV
ncbi:MAG TPA: putative quinol monooxygenase [Gaiellaceae bacterium]|nr:putative quinol monooxygenase [Gaiellaceae bacterium]